MTEGVFRKYYMVCDIYNNLNWAENIYNSNSNWSAIIISNFQYFQCSIIILRRTGFKHNTYLQFKTINTGCLFLTVSNG